MKTEITKTDEMMNVALVAILSITFTVTLMVVNYIDYYKETEKNIPYASKSQINEIAIFKTSLVGYPLGKIEEFTIAINHSMQEVCKPSKKSEE